MTYRTHDGRPFDRRSLTEALAMHKQAGLIRDFRDTGQERPNRAWPLFVITTSDGHDHWLASDWELHAFLAGLASARNAYETRAARERAAVEQDEAERQKRLQAEHDRDAWVTENYPCTTCGARPGDRCTRQVVDDTPYAAHPHAARKDRANHGRESGLALAEGMVPG